MRVRAGLVNVIYSKALVLSNDERTRASGDIVNLMSVDATRLQDLCTYGLIAISGPLQVTRFYHLMTQTIDLHVDNSCIHITVQPSRVVSFCWCWCHGIFHSTQYLYGLIFIPLYSINADLSFQSLHVF